MALQYIICRIVQFPKLGKKNVHLHNLLWNNKFIQNVITKMPLSVSNNTLFRGFRASKHLIAESRELRGLRNEVWNTTWELMNWTRSLCQPTPDQNPLATRIKRCFNDGPASETLARRWNDVWPACPTDRPDVIPEDCVHPYSNQSIFPFSAVR